MCISHFNEPNAQNELQIMRPIGKNQAWNYCFGVLLKENIAECFDRAWNDKIFIIILFKLYL